MRTYTGVVVAAHRCAKTVKVRVPKLIWNKKLRKNYTKYDHHLAHDANEALVPGDVVKITSGFRSSSLKRHLVTELVVPFGTAEARKPIQTVEEWVMERQEKRIRRGKEPTIAISEKPEVTEWWRKGFGTGKDEPLLEELKAKDKEGGETKEA